MSSGNGRSRRLIGWKAIGQYLGCTERTAKRWEAHRGLPVRRMPGGGRGLVWADPEELTQWLRTSPPAADTDLPEAAGEPAADSDEAALSGSVAEESAAEPLLEEPVPEREQEPYRAQIPPGDMSAVVAAPEPATLPQAVAPPPAQPWWRIALPLLLAAIGIAGVTRAILSTTGVSLAIPTHTPYDDVPQDRELYQNARFEVATRTPDGLAAAQSAFRRLVEKYPERAAGWSGLADTYLLMREFSSMRDEQAYPEAARAARTAVALDPQLADAWLDQAFVAFWWEGDVPVAFKAFDNALALDPQAPRAYWWYATALSAHGDFSRSLDMIARARTLDPTNRAIVADESWLRFTAGQHDEAVSNFERMVQLDPQFVSWHAYLSRAYLVLGRDSDFLREARAAAILRHQDGMVQNLERAAEQLAAGGRAAMLDQLSRNEEEAWRAGNGSAETVAIFRGLAQDHEGMMRWLNQAERDHDELLRGVRCEPAFDQYRNDPQFQAFIARQP
jgi:tetratricopeptide (TPR) repeat protein